MLIRDPEHALDEEELRIPMLGASSAHEAYRRTLESGHRVVVSDHGYLWEVTPDGRRIQGKKIEPRVPVKIGTKLIIR